MEDAQIIDGFFRRDPEAITAVQEKYEKRCLAAAGHILPDRRDAEECVNDTYLRTWNAIPPARPGAFRAWLGRITRNLSLDRWKRDRAQRRGGDDFSLLLGELDVCLPDADRAQRHLEDQEIADLISRFLRQQSAFNRRAFLRRYWYGESIEEIAAALDCGTGKVKSALFRTRSALRTCLEKEGVAI